ncbi:MAG: CcmD family protein [Desulfovibrionaceae bacterium]|nr:CcmD family protein [Desulfovibrionaceae bacterium]
MNALNWLVAANALLWLGLGAYVAWMARAQRHLEQRVLRQEQANLEHAHD